MVDLINENKKKITDIFLGEFKNHVIVMECPENNHFKLEDYTLNKKPLKEYMPWAVSSYQSQLKWLKDVQDDSVPYINLVTNTGIYAAAFGCPIKDFQNSRPAALHIVNNAAQAEKIKLPDYSNCYELTRILEFAQLLVKEMGDDVPISVPDIQSPFDIVAQIWNKEDLFISLIEYPEIVLELVEKCKKLLTDFLTEYIKVVPNLSTICCMNFWGPRELGINVSEDEAGSMSKEAFEKFCLPSLIDLSNTFNGFVLHCCASADHVNGSFCKIPNLYGQNRIIKGYNENVFLYNPVSSILDFPDDVVRMVGWFNEDAVKTILKTARQKTRFLFQMAELPLDEAKRTLENVRNLCNNKVNGLL